MSSYRYVHFWDFVGHSDAINCVALSGDGKKLGSGGMDNKILIWNVDSKALLHSIEANSPVLCMSWIKIIDKDVLFCGTEGGQVLTVSESTAVFLFYCYWHAETPTSILLQDGRKTVVHITSTVMDTKPIQRLSLHPSEDMRESSHFLLALSAGLSVHVCAVERDKGTLNWPYHKCSK